MKQKLFIVCLLLLSAAACDNTAENASEDLAVTETLQIFLRGEDQPLSRLGGLHPGDVIELEAKAKGLSTPPQWFSADGASGDFSSPGKLYLKKSGRFLVGAVAGDQSAYIKVEVLASTSPGSSGSPPQDPGNNPGNPGDPGDPGDPDPPGNQPPASVPSDSFMDEVISFTPGPHAGFGSPDFPQIVLGPPQGGGNLMGSFHVLSLGVGGEIILKSATPILNGAGEDFIVFENAFFAGGSPNAPFVELGQVSLSQDGTHFFPFNCETQNPAEFYPGCAGVHPVLANSELNDIDPTDPDAAGGDAFDLNDLGLSWALYVKIKDLSMVGAGVSAGFDLDAIAIIHQ